MVDYSVVWPHYMVEPSHAMRHHHSHAVCQVTWRDSHVILLNEKSKVQKDEDNVILFIYIPVYPVEMCVCMRVCVSICIQMYLWACLCIKLHGEKDGSM